ncbi:MAG: lysine--tRNA ligase [Candidatus Aenigmarchaeota archaeon]|nr:lysine--tRNA ligase [Candidatus Aenigmarchaeota archaeon]
MEDVFWADQIAAQAIERAKKEGNIVTCRSAASTSGAKHIGNIFDVAKSYIVHKAVLKKGFESRFVLTHDDRDPLRAIPDRVPDLEGKWHSISEKKFEQWLGHPYVNVPDPFGCCTSWADHFAKVWESGICSAGITDVKVFSTDKLYRKGVFDPYVLKALEKIGLVQELMQKFQETKTENYIPFDAVCGKCGKITTVAVDFDLKKKRISYECSGKELAGKYKIDGCGHTGTAGFRDGKLPWSFEWPAQWAIFKTTFGPFGKEHAEGSWPRCSAIMREIYGKEPPIPHIYEFLLINGEKMSARRGNAYIAQEMVRIVEPEVFLYFYTKRSKKQRDLDLVHIEHMVNDFEHAERVYFGIDKEKNEQDKINLMRMYESSMDKIPKKMPLRVPYQFAALISQIHNPEEGIERAISLLKSTGHVRSLTKKDRQYIRKRLFCAKNWAESFAPEEMKIVLHETNVKLSEQESKALSSLLKILTKKINEPELQNQIYEIAKSSGMDPKDFFRIIYRILTGRDSGPRLGPFIISIGEKKVAMLLKKAVQ